MRLIRLKEVIHLTGLGRSSIYKFMADNKFPQSISLGERAVAWDESEVEEWLQSKIENRVTISSAENQSVNTVTEEEVIVFIKNKFCKVSITEAITWIMTLIK